MNFALYIAGRISPNGIKGQGAPAVKVAVIAVSLSVAVMIAAIAIVTGFKREITNKITGFNAHISLYQVPLTEEDGNVISLSPSMENVLNEIPYISDYSLQLSIPAILKTSDDFQGIYLKSLEGEGIKQFLLTCLVEGSIPDYSKEDNELSVLISEIMATRLGLKVGDRIDTYFINNSIRVRPLKVAGIYSSHFDTYDKVFAYGSLEMIQKIAELRKGQGTAIAVHTHNIDHIDELTLDLRGRLDKAYADGMIFNPLRIDNARNQGAGYFQWLELLDTNVVVILLLMTFVSIVTLISGLLIIILDNKRLIGLLRALGTPVRTVRKIFVYLALKITLLGMLIGNVLALGVLYVQNRWHLIPLDSASYYIDFVPVEIRWQSLLILNVAVIMIVWGALILPSWLTAKISPAETLRYE